MTWDPSHRPPRSRRRRTTCGGASSSATRKFIFAGAATFTLLLPLALTSTNGAVRRLGFAGWKRLHRLAYVAGATGVLHFVWRVKKDLREPALYALVIGALLLVRMAVYVRARLARAAVAQ